MRGTKRADATGVTQPWNTDVLTDLQAFDVRAERINAPNNLVAGNDGYLRMRQLTVDNMKVRAADAASTHLRESASRRVAGRRARSIQAHRRSCLAQSRGSISPFAQVRAQGGPRPYGFDEVMGACAPFTLGATGETLLAKGTTEVSPALG